MNQREEIQNSLSGILLAMLGMVVSQLKSVKTLERRIINNEPTAESCPEGL